MKFDEWFANSKVVTSKGKPRLLYHGTWKRFDKFQVPIHGVYFTDNLKAALSYGEVIKVYLSIQNPLILDFEGQSDLGENENILEEVAFANKEGFDGLIVYNTFDGENYLDQYVVFAENQIFIVQ